MNSFATYAFPNKANDTDNVFVPEQNEGENVCRKRHSKAGISVFLTFQSSREGGESGPPPP